MDRIEIGSIVRVRSDYFVHELSGRIGMVVAYSNDRYDEDILVQFDGMEGHPDLHDGSIYGDRPLDGVCNKRWIRPTYLELVEKEDAMPKLEIGSMVRVLDSCDNHSLVGKSGKVVAYSTVSENVVVKFEGMEGHPELHSAAISSDRPLDDKQDKWFIHPKDLEVLVKEENKQMTQDTLKSGMTVKLRNGYVYLVVNDGLSREFGFEPFVNYKDDLIHISDKEFDIVEVYLYDNPTYGNSTSLDAFLDLDSTGMKLLWKRQDLPKLSSAERVILENLDKNCKWIARDKSESLYVYNNKPVKHRDYWDIIGMASTLEFPKLFTFVKWEDEQPYNIEELLKGEK